MRSALRTVRVPRTATQRLRKSKVSGTPRFKAACDTKLNEAAAPAPALADTARLRQLLALADALHEEQPGQALRPGRAAAALARRLGELLDDPARREMGEAGRRRVRDEFTFAAQAEQYERLLGRLVPTRKAVAHACR